MLEELFYNGWEENGWLTRLDPKLGAQVIYRGTYVLVPTLGVVNWLL